MARSHYIAELDRSPPFREKALRAIRWELLNVLLGDDAPNAGARVRAGTATSGTEKQHGTNSPAGDRC